MTLAGVLFSATAVSTLCCQNPQDPKGAILSAKPGPKVRRRLCPDSVVLYVGSPSSTKKLRAELQSLANVLHRPVHSIVWTKPDTDGEEIPQAKPLRHWIEAQLREEIQVDILALAVGNDLAQEALKDIEPPKGKVALFAMGTRRGFALQGIEISRFSDGRMTRSAEGELTSLPDSGKAQRSFELQVRDLRERRYGKAFDRLLEPRESLRYPRRIGLVEMRMVACPEYRGRPAEPFAIRFDLEEEKRRLSTWLDVPRNAKRVKRDPMAIQLFNRLPADKGGPKNWYLEWYPMHRRETAEWKRAKAEGRERPQKRWSHERHSLAHRHFLPINMHEEAFVTEDFAPKQLRASNDAMGRACLAYEIRPRRARAYADFTERNQRRHSAIMIRGMVRVAPMIVSRITGRGQISGSFSHKEIEALITDVRGMLDRQTREGR